jgi:hypothetical protein
MAQLVEALRCKPESRGLDSLRGHWDISLTSFGRTVALGLTEMSSSGISRGMRGRRGAGVVRGSDNLTTFVFQSAHESGKAAIISRQLSRNYGCLYLLEL